MRIALLSLFALTFVPAIASACPGDGDGAVTASAKSGTAGDVASADADKKAGCPGCPSCPGKAAAAATAKTAKAGEAAKVGEVTIGQLVDMRNHGGKLAILDANGEETRATFGLIPGAIALTSYKEFDVAKELPADKATTLVFYCSSQKCGASHLAADRAKAAGYANVLVLPAGIKGWSKAGQKTTLNQS